MRYEVVDPAERRTARVGVIGVVALMLAFGAGMTVTAVVVVASTLWLQVTFGALAAAALVWIGLFTVQQLPAVWHVDPLLVVDEDGLTLRTHRFSGVGEPRRVQLAWSEITTVGVGPLAPPPVPPPQPDATAARVYLEWRARAGVHQSLALPQVGSSTPRAVVVVGLRARSLAQDAEFRRRRTELLETIRRMHAVGARPAGTDPVIDELITWQQEWTARPHPVGMLLAVPQHAVDPDRLDAALRTAGLTQGLRRLDAAAYSVLDTPHDLARHLTQTLPWAGRADDRPR
ncbi:MAG: hypothetical protein ACT4RN_03335 [Pseudonocardia sp.]